MADLLKIGEMQAKQHNGKQENAWFFGVIFSKRKVIMKLKSFRVQNFRSFLDSGWIDCQDLTAIAGVNEAGKSNLLKGLWKLKPAFQADNQILHSDLPRDNFDELMKMEKLPDFVSAKFELEPKDQNLLQKYFPMLKKFDHLKVSRSLYGKYTLEVPITVPESEAKKLHDFIIKIMPGFIYYSNYGNLDSNIYLPQMLKTFNKKGVSTISPTKKRTIKLLLLYVGITPEMLKKDMPVLFNGQSDGILTASELQSLIVKKKEYQKLFERAGERLSKEFAEVWKQGDYKFEFVFEGENLKIWVTDGMGNRAPLEERSVGMQWFLSFFLVFSLESKMFYTNTILLLDESGMTLHGFAQQDLVDFMEQMSKTNQIVYTTHSNYMLPTKDLNRAKMVFKDDKGHSMVSNDLKSNGFKSSKDSLLPVQSAVGIEVSKSILMSSEKVLVLSTADQFLLTAMKNFLGGKGKIKARQDVVFVSAGLNGLDATAQVLSEGSELPIVFLSGKNETKACTQLLQKTYKEDAFKIKKLSDFGDFDTIEDVVPYEIFARSSGNYLIRILDANFELETNLPFVEQIEEYAQEKGYVLPESYREEIAKRTKNFMNKNFDDIKLDRGTKKLWTKMLREILKI